MTSLTRHYVQVWWAGLREIEVQLAGRRALALPRWLSVERRQAKGMRMRQGVEGPKAER